MHDSEQRGMVNYNTKLKHIRKKKQIINDVLKSFDNIYEGYSSKVSLQCSYSIYSDSTKQYWLLLLVETHGDKLKSTYYIDLDTRDIKVMDSWILTGYL